MPVGSAIHSSPSGMSFVVLVGVASMLLGCTPSQPAKSQMSGLSIKANGRTLSARVPAPSTIQQEDETIVLTSGTHKMVIERERILLDNAELIKIPAETGNISVGISETGLLTIDRDFKSLITKQL